MQVFTTVSDMRGYSDKQRLSGRKIGFVPTMGALHAGHLSLVETARQHNDCVVASIYVNPVQFNNLTDFETYPVMPERDLALLSGAGCEAVFMPSHAEMYPQGYRTGLIGFDFGALATELEGKHRPGHFNGVGIVVSKLLHIVGPDNAYFGQKDLQQYLIIRKLVQDLSFGINIVRCPTLRESDGLAMSSRNMRLTPEERAVAPLLSQTLAEAGERIGQGQSVAEVKQWAWAQIAAEPRFAPEYVEVADMETLQLLDRVAVGQPFAILTAAHLGKARLIDNMVFE